MLLPIERCREFFDSLHAAGAARRGRPTCCSPRSARASATCAEVGLGYLTLDRQSRTLSGGEVQRINLTTALGTSLVNTLFVLDEPSIGLHPRDMGRVIGVMHRLRDAGNSLVVVEHDPQIMLAADRMLDMGPGPGERGGEMVFFGTPGEILQATPGRSPPTTSPAASVPGGQRRRRPGRRRASQLLGATEHNLKNIDVRFRCSGWSAYRRLGSGKSTLVQDVLYAALLQAPRAGPRKLRARIGRSRRGTHR